MKCADMSMEMIQHLALRCTDRRALKLRNYTGKVPADSGDYFAVPAKTEVMKRYWRAAKKDLRDRELRGGSYPGDVGHVSIGGKRFSYFPRSGMLVREDFEKWAEANHASYTKMDGSERDSTRPVRQEDVGDDSDFALAKEARRIARDLKPAGQIYPVQAWNTEFQMRADLNVLVSAFKDCLAQGECFPLLKADCDLLAAKIAYRQRKFAQAKTHLVNLAAAALKAAMFVQEHHSTNEDQNN